MAAKRSFPSKQTLKHRCLMLGIHRDPCVREMVELYERYGHRVFLLMPIFQEELFRSEPKLPRRPGAPKIWSDINTMHAWLACERLWRLAKVKNPKISLSQALEKVFKWPEKTPWMIVVSGGCLAINDVATARRLHSRGQKLLATKPEKHREYWEKLVQC